MGLFILQKAYSKVKNNPIFWAPPPFCRQTARSNPTGETIGFHILEVTF